MSQTTSNVIRLEKPAVGATSTIHINAVNMKLALGFEPDPNAVEKNGQNLEFSFEDGGKIVLVGYYDHFASKTLPVVVTETGGELSGEDFLASLREDLLTAAGPDSGIPSSGAGEYADDAGSLIEGLGRLSSFGIDSQGQDAEGSISGALDGVAAAFVPRIAITPMIPGNPSTPAGPGEPGNSTSGTPNYYIAGQGYNLEIDESYMAGGTNYQDGGNPSYVMEFLITSNDGVASIGIGNVTYAVEGGTLAGFVSVSDSNGTLTNAQVVNNGNGTHTLSFTYTQGHAHSHTQDGKDIADNVDVFVITANSTSGVSTSTTANVDIVDDVPVVAIGVDPNVIPVEGGVITGHWDVQHGYDGEVSTSVVFKGVEYTFGHTIDTGHGDLVVNANGIWTLMAAKNFHKDEDREISFGIKAVDTDGDETIGTVRFTVVGEQYFNSASTAIISFNTVEGTEFTSNASALLAALHGGSTDDGFLPVGRDLIEGGDGNDILFGDAMTANFMLSDSWTSDNGETNYSWTVPSDLNEGDSYSIVTSYLDSAHGKDQWTNGDLHTFVMGNAEKLGQSGTEYGDNDFINGGARHDIIFGQGGEDIIFGGQGSDILHGGTHSDIFAWSNADLDSSTDTILDFELGTDHIYFQFLEGEGELDVAKLTALIQNQKLSVDINMPDNSFTLTVQNGEDAVTVDVRVMDGDLSHHSDSTDHAQAALLFDILVNSGV